MKKLYISCLLATLSPIGMSAAITAVQQNAGTAGGYQLVFKNAGVQPTSFSTQSPASIVLDFANTTSKLPSREVAVASQGIYSVDVIPGQGSTRAVVRLAGPMYYDVSLQGKDVVLNIANNQGAASVGQAGALAGLANASAAPIPVASTGVQFTQTNAVDTVVKPAVSFSPLFRKNDNGNGTLTFNLPNANTKVDVKTEGNKVVADIYGYQIDNSEQKRLELSDFKTPVNFADIAKSKSGTKVTLNMGKNPYEFVTYQSGNAYTIEIMKPQADPAKVKAEQLMGFSESKNYRGERLSLNFQDIEVRAVLQIIAEFTNQNIVVSDSVVGNITLRLDNVPWDQALDIILKTKGLDKRTNSNVIYVAPQEELNTFELTALRNIKERDELLPTRTEYIQVKFAKASEIMAIIEKSRQNTGGGTNDLNRGDSILSSKGTISVDERTNTLLVNDIPSKLQAVRDLVAKLDEPVRQVLVDARLVVTEDEYSKNLGSRLGLSFINRGSSALTSGTGSISGANSLNSSIVAGDNPIALPGLNDRLGVNLPAAPATGTAASYGLAILGKDFLVDLELSALETEGQIEIVSSPRVVTQDGNKARVASGTKIPTITVSDNTATVTYESAELSLDVTPRIAPNDMVDMELLVTNNTEGTRITIGENVLVPINTNELNTNVLVDNGETIVLGGVYQQRQALSQDKVPLLGDIPIVGNAFKSTSRTFNKKELLIFITPRIIDKRMAEYDKYSNLRQ